MREMPMERAPKDGGDPIRLQIIADRLQLEGVLKLIAEGEQVKAVIGWTPAIPESGLKVPQLAPERYVRRLPIPEGGPNRTRYLRVEKIHWVAAERQYLRLHLGIGKSILVRGREMTIERLALRLDPKRFMRVHRSHIVSLEKVEALRTDAPTKRYAELVGGRQVPVSQVYWEPLAASLIGDAR